MSGSNQTRKGVYGNLCSLTQQVGSTGDNLSLQLAQGSLMGLSPPQADGVGTERDRRTPSCHRIRDYKHLFCVQVTEVHREVLGFPLDADKTILRIY